MGPVSMVSYGYGDPGYGDGCGYGYGYGDGCGYGYGSDKGDNAIRYWSQISEWFWWSDKDGMPCNGGDIIQPAAVGVVHEIKGPIKLCKNALHADRIPTKWQGSRLWTVKFIGPIVIEGSKCGGLTRVITGEIGAKP